ncbi:MAG: GntR family transcriptional regulator [Nitriliruptoraceae bacterium]|nr:GntR family transcriptional regulator [Nitriliruptoraceae bacterium]
MARSTSPLGARTSLSERLTQDLNQRILAGEWDPGSRLPCEAERAPTSAVSGVTVRPAPQALEVRGLVRIRHGAGSFVQELGDGILAGLPQLRSISETIRELGHDPEVVWRPVIEREATDEEASRLDLEEEARTVIHLERAFLADGEPVAFSIDRIPLMRAGPRFREALGAGSMFRLFEEHGLQPTRAVAAIHAEHEPDLAWPGTPPASTLFVVLDQLHEDSKGVPLALSRSYFVEGRFQFRVLRAR